MCASENDLGLIHDKRVPMNGYPITLNCTRTQRFSQHLN
ncbi:hypothetical protein L21SP2_0823 [Salinispira pacifica]|uniref:Uncharacterized protein n=1 Tax=Salinispira pacifica TaxID=1307761 RepID=V5WF33_9SPIO|nr:hypothetical protein L21SP2_0823 [Salinispira pacifica]